MKDLKAFVIEQLRNELARSETRRAAATHAMDRMIVEHQVERARWRLAVIGLVGANAIFYGAWLLDSLGVL